MHAPSSDAHSSEAPSSDSPSSDAPSCDAHSSNATSSDAHSSDASSSEKTFCTQFYNIKDPLQFEIIHVPCRQQFHNIYTKSCLILKLQSLTNALQ